MMVLGQKKVVAVGTWRTGSIEGGTGQYIMVLCQYRSVLVDTLWYWVTVER